MSENPQAAGNEDDIKRKLMRRVAFAGVLIAMLLGALAFVDYLGQPGEETASSGPTFTAPVPVAKKEVTQPVKPAEPEAAPVAKEPAAAEATAAPPAPAPAADLPVRPEVAAQPALPRTESRGEVRGEARSAASPPARVMRPAEPATPAEGTAAASSPASSPASSQFAPPPGRTAVPTQPLSPPVTGAPQAPAPLAPPRLFSGYAVQAGVFSDAQHAEELRAKLMLNGIPSTLEARVQVGPFKSREEAEAARQKLKTLGIEGILLPPKGAKR